MNTIQRIAKNVVVLLVSRSADYIIRFFFVIYTARYLGAEGFGVLSFALAFTGLFAMITNLGLNTLTVREVARDKSVAAKYLGNVALMKICAVILMFILVVATIHLLRYPQDTITVVYLIALSVVLDAFSSMFYSVFQAYERMEFVSLGRIIGSASKLVGVFCAIRLGMSVPGFASLYLIASGIVVIFTFLICRTRFATFRLELDWHFWKKSIVQALPFGLSGFFVVVYLRIDTVMLSLFKTDAVVGWYSAANRLIFLLLFIPAAFFSSLFPVIAQFYQTADGSLRTAYSSSLRYMAMVALPIGVGTTLLAHKIIPFIYGSEYSPSVVALQVLIWSIVFSYLSQAPMYALYSTNRQLVYTKIVFVCMVVNILFNLMLIPPLSYTGAAIATVFTQGIAFIAVFGYVTRLHFGSPITVPFAVRLSVCVLGMSVFIIALRGVLGVIPLIVLSTVVYFVLLWLLRVFSSHDRHILQRLFKGRLSTSMSI